MSTAPPYTESPAAKLAEGILHAIDNSQQQAFIKEVKELSSDVQSSISLSEAIHALLLEEDSRVNQPKTLDLQAEEWFSAQETYKSKVRAIKRIALKARAEVIFPFVKSWAGFPDEAPDEDVIAEFEGFSEDIVINQGNTLNFNETFHAVKVLKRNCASKLETDRSYDPDIKKLNEDIEKLEEIEKAAIEKINSMVPGIFAKYGLNGRSHKLTLLLACGPLALVRSLKGLLSSSGKSSVTTMDTTDDKKDDKKDSKPDDKKGDKKDDKKDGKKDDKQDDKKPPGIGLDSLDKPVKELTDIHALWVAADIVEECETKLKESRSKLDTLLYKQEQSKNNQGRWNVLISRASALEAKMNHILPKLDSISKMPEAVCSPPCAQRFSHSQ
ncbi:hypothetical protein DL96DRAFT_1638604 [Flagelloscypha sp. PMI_526]|nr:hypothetical protein DL96DRAFT_1638604 [Flagelloscypha sp. PMI_526]